MGEERAGIRILSKQNPYFSRDPKIVVFSRDPDSMAFTEVAGNVEALLGFPEPDWLAPGFWQSRIHPEDAEEACRFGLQCNEDREDHELEYRVLNNRGGVVWIHEIIEYDRNSDRARGYILDISSRVAQESDVQQALNLRHLLLEFLTRDLSGPVNEISGFGRLLERHLSACQDDVGSDMALGLRDGIERLSVLVARLKTLSQQGEMSFQEMSESLTALRVDDAVNRS